MEQAFFVRVFMQRQVFRRHDIGPLQPARLNSSRLYPSMLRNASLASMMRSNSPDTMPATVDSAGSCRGPASLVQQRFVNAVTRAKVAHHPGKAL